MLIKFSVANFRSIKNRIEINMLRTSLKGSDDNVFELGRLMLLKTSLIYGPNASGKSNLLLALRALDYLVLNSANLKPDQNIGPYEPFRLDDTSEGQPVELDIEFFQSDVRYLYSIKFNKDTILEEELYYYPKLVKSLLFTRDANRKIKFGDSYKGERKSIKNLLLKNQLFFSKAAENNVESVLEPYKFFQTNIFSYSTILDRDDKSVKNRYYQHLAKNPDSEFSKKFNLLIGSLDTGIKSVSAVETDWDDFKFPSHISEEIQNNIREDYKYEIKTKHIRNGNPDDLVTFDIDVESSGTKVLFLLGGLILDALLRGNTLLIDEVESNLHPTVTKYLIDLFHNKFINKKNAQLIVTTHDTVQLSNDKLRRDQVWFVEKNEEGFTEIERCSNIPGIRLDTPLDKWYTSGKFGGTPIIDDLEFELEMMKD